MFYKPLEATDYDEADSSSHPRQPSENMAYLKVPGSGADLQ